MTVAETKDDKLVLITDQEFKDFLENICAVGEDMGIELERFTVLLRTASEYLSQVQGIELQSIRREDA